MIVAGTEEGVCMVEGSMNEISEEATTNWPKDDECSSNAKKPTLTS